MAEWCLPKAEGGRGLGRKTAGKIRTTASRIFRYAMANKLGVKEDPTKLMESEKLSSGEQVTPASTNVQDTAQTIPMPSRGKLLHKVTEKEVLTPQETKALILATTPGVHHRRKDQRAVSASLVGLGSGQRRRYGPAKFIHGKSKRLGCRVESPGEK
jgi:hypothetical protein